MGKCVSCAVGHLLCVVQRRSGLSRSHCPDVLGYTSGV